MSQVTRHCCNNFSGSQYGVLLFYPLDVPGFCHFIFYSKLNRSLVLAELNVPRAKASSPNTPLTTGCGQISAAAQTQL
jgi:hypothetical protein